MTQTVWKTVTPVDDYPHEVELPGNAQLVRTEVYDFGGRDVASPEVWAWWRIANVDAPKEPRRLQVTGTGHPVPDAWRFLGTAPQFRAGLIWHLWEVHRDR